MGNPLVCVLMCVYNDDLYLEESIQCILNQTLRNFEFIIINDGSNQKTADILNKITDVRVRVVHNPSNIGLTSSLNIGLSMARAKYIARQDANDISLPQRLQKQFEFMETHDSSLVGCGVIYLNETGEEISRFLPPQEEETLKNSIVTKNRLAHSSIFFRNDPKIRYREKFKFAQDYDLYLRLISDNKKISVIPEYLIKYRILKNAISFHKRAQQFLFREKAREFYFQRVSYKKDSYDSFDPSEILDLNIETTKNHRLLAEQIKAYHHSGDYFSVRRLCKRYIFCLKKYDRIILYYFLSFCPKKFIVLSDKIIFFLNSYLKKND